MPTPTRRSTAAAAAESRGKRKMKYQTFEGIGNFDDEDQNVFAPATYLRLGGVGSSSSAATPMNKRKVRGTESTSGRRSTGGYTISPEPVLNQASSSQKAPMRRRLYIAETDDEEVEDLDRQVRRKEKLAKSRAKALKEFEKVLAADEEDYLEAVKLADSISHVSVKSTPKPTPKREGRRRDRKAWTDAEFEALYRGMMLYGPQWNMIMKDERFGVILSERTVVDLKDKARNEAKARTRLAERTGSDPKLGPFEYVSMSGGDGARAYVL